jgi:uncharacterized membrane protein
MIKKIFLFVVVVCSVYLFFLCLSRFYNFRSEAIDVSYYRVAVDQLRKFQIPRIWDEPNRFVWGDHFEPIIFLFVPFNLLFKSPYVLIVGQAFFVLLAAIPLFLSAKHLLKNFYLAIALIIAYLFFGGLEMGYMYGFHPILLSPFFLFWLYYFFLKKNWRGYFIFIFLSLFVKEEISFTLIFFGIYQLFSTLVDLPCHCEDPSPKLVRGTRQSILFKITTRLLRRFTPRKDKVARRKIKISMVTILISLLWSLLCFKIIFPHFSPTGFLHFGQYGGSLINFVTNPSLLISTLASPDYKFETFLVSYGSFAFLPLVYPPTFIITIPAILEKLLSSGIAGMNGFHYSAVITAVILIASIESLNVILKQKQIGIINRSGFWIEMILLAAVWSHLFYGYQPFYPPSSHTKLIYEIISKIPENKSISASYQIAARISRPLGKILPLPRFPETSDYIVIDSKMPLVITGQEAMKKYAKAISGNKNYKVERSEDGIIVWKLKTFDKKNEN